MRAVRRAASLIAGLLPAVAPDGTWAFKGYRLTAFTNEEAAVGLAIVLAFFRTRKTIRSDDADLLRN